MLTPYVPGEAEAYIRRKGWEFKRSGDELVMACPTCQKAGKFYVNDQTGLFSCKSGSCGQKGNHYQLLKSQGDIADIAPLAKITLKKAKTTWPLASIAPFEAALASSQDALDYLAARGLTLDTAQAWHLGYKNQNGVQQLLIPYIRNEQVVDIKYRLLPASEDGARPKYHRLPNGESILYGGHLMKEAKADRRRLWMVEGEIDALTLWERGFWPVISTTTGAASFKPEWWDAIEAFDPEQIIVCYDSDASGQRGADAILKKFVDRKIVNIVLADAKDVNEFFQQHTAAEFEQLCAEAVPDDIENVKSMTTVLNDLEQQLWFTASGFDGVTSDHPELNAMIAGGYWNGQLVVLTAPSGCGKTSFILQDLLALAKQGIPGYLLCLEMPEVMMMRKIITKEYGIPMLELTQAHVNLYRRQLESYPLYLGSRCRTVETVESTIGQAVSRYNLKIAVLDNVNFLVRSIDHTTQEIGRATKMLKDLAVELNIVVVAIAQPRKFDKDSRVMTGNDLRDSSQLEADADTLIILHRQRLKSEAKDVGSGASFLGNQSPFCLVRVEKARYAPGGETTLYFDGARSTFRQLTAGERMGLNGRVDR